MTHGEYNIYKMKEAVGRGEQADLRYACDIADRIVAAINNANDVETLKKGFTAFRARNDCDHEYGEYGEPISINPLKEKALTAPPKEITELGRFNPPRQPVLYLSATREVALAESKSLPSDACTVATFKTVRSVKIAKLLRHEGIVMEMLDQPQNQESFEKWLLLEAAHFASRRVQDHDRDVHYRTCNLIASAFRDSGFEGLAYRSSFWSPGWQEDGQASIESSILSSNIVLFDPEAARPLQSALFSIDWKRPAAKQENGNIWNAKEND